MGFVNQDFVAHFLGLALEGLLHGDCATILLTDDCTDDWALLAAHRVARYVVGDGEEDQWVQLDRE